MQEGTLEHALFVIEKLRPLLAKNDGGAFRVCQDAALEAGFMFSAVRSRTVSIKKGRRHLARFGSWVGQRWLERNLLPPFHSPLPVDIVASPALLDGEAQLMDGRLFVASNPNRPQTLLFSDPNRGPGEIFGIDASSYERWAKSPVYTYQSDILFIELAQEEVREKAREKYAARFTERALIGRSLERPIILAKPKKKRGLHAEDPAWDESKAAVIRPRIPRQLLAQQKRLDGRRR